MAVVWTQSHRSWPPSSRTSHPTWAATHPSPAYRRVTLPTTARTSLRNPPVVCIGLTGIRAKPKARERKRRMEDLLLPQQIHFHLILTQVLNGLYLEQPHHHQFHNSSKTFLPQHHNHHFLTVYHPIMTTTMLLLYQMSTWKLKKMITTMDPMGLCHPLGLHLYLQQDDRL